ncbi:hypothetical protein PMAYCL1PPCAC_17759, partial [Pristionchus mayeri]
VGSSFILMDSPLLPFSNFSHIFDNPPDLDVVIGSTLREMDSPQGDQSHPGTFIDGINLRELERIHEVIIDGENGTKHTPATDNIFLSVYSVARSVIKGGNKAFVYSYQQSSEHNYHTDDFSFIAGVHMFDRDENEMEIANFYPEFFVNFTLTGRPSPGFLS